MIILNLKKRKKKKKKKIKILSLFGVRGGIK
jgi:hypothetical protein